MPDGYAVRYRHTRDYVQPFPAPSAKGGKTEAFVYDSNGNLVCSGTAICHPKDSFNKKIGRLVALGRALKFLEDPFGTKELAEQERRLTAARSKGRYA